MKRMVLSLVMTLFLVSVVFAANEIVINEIMYNNSGSDVEFVELYNTTDLAINLTGWSLLDDNASHTPCQLSGSIAAHGYFVIAGNRTDFLAKYPNVSPLNANDYDTGSDAWSFGNGGDEVNLYTNTQVLHDQVIYEDGGDWPSSPDGDGPSLELLYPSLDNALPASWDPSTVDGGTPGAVNSVYTTNVAPICRDGDRLTDLPSASDEVTVTVVAFDNEGLAKVELMVSTGSGYSAIAMNDNGTGKDVTAGDSIFTASIPAYGSGTLVKYYAIATDDIGQTDLWPNKAPDDYHAYTVGYQPPDIRVNEVLAVNKTVNNDDYGEFDDWFELYNAGSSAVNLGGMFVSTALGSSQMFELPDQVLQAGAYLLIWADNDEEQGSLHTNFKLSSEGESIAIFETVDHGNVLIHGWKYGRMSENVSMGFLPEDGTAPEYLATPTPGASNASSEVFSQVCINEFQSTSALGGPDDWIEIYNRGESAYDLSGCFLSDERGDNTKWAFPQGTVSIIQPGEYLVAYEDEMKFGWSSDGDDVIMLTAPDSTTGLDFYDFGAQLADHSEGRYPDGAGYWQTFDTPTKGAENGGTGAVDEKGIQTPESITLYPNYPNPFNPSTTITFTIAEKAKATIQVFNAVGQQVALLADQTYLPGTHAVQWQAGNMPSGTYWVRLKSGSVNLTRKMILLK